MKLGVQSVENVIDWSKQICLVLNYLHSLKPAKIHRDIKPANLILMYDGRIKLIDFGIMREFNPKKAEDTCCLGTRGYAAPEQFGGRGQTDARTDIYGLGMTMFHLVTGVDPKDAPYKIMPICKIDPSLPKGLEYIITKCTQVYPEARYQNCSDLINDLNNYIHLPPKNYILKKVIKRIKGR